MSRFHVKPRPEELAVSLDWLRREVAAKDEAARWCNCKQPVRAQRYMGRPLCARCLKLVR